MGVTIKDVAKLANVSLGTASMAINNKPGISEATKLNVLEAVKKLKYRPNHYARSLITNKSSTIGLIVTDITNPFFGLIVSSIQKVAEENGYHILLGISNDKNKKEKKIVDYFVSRNVEGVIIVPTLDKENDLSHIYNLRHMDIPFVFVTTAYKGIEADCVMTDLGKGTYELTKYLLKNGHRKIFFISGYNELITSSVRIDGYKQAFKEFNIFYDNEWILECYPDFEAGYSITSQILDNGIPDAIISINDVLAMGVMKNLKDNNIKVPEQVSVAGYDDLLYTSILETPLTTVKQPICDLCSFAVDILINRINDNTTPVKKVYLEPQLIIRKSTLRKNS